MDMEAQSKTTAFQPTEMTSKTCFKQLLVLRLHRVVFRLFFCLLVCFTFFFVFYIFMLAFANLD